MLNFYFSLLLQPLFLKLAVIGLVLGHLEAVHAARKAILPDEDSWSDGGPILAGQSCQDLLHDEWVDLIQLAGAAAAGGRYRGQVSEPETRYSRTNS